MNMYIKHKKMRTFCTLPNRFYRSQDSNGNLHIIGMPLGCNQTTQKDSRQPSSARAKSMKIPSCKVYINKHLMQIMCKPNLIVS